MKVKLDETRYPIPTYFERSYSKVCKLEFREELVEQWMDKLKNMSVFYNNNGSTLEFFVSANEDDVQEFIWCNCDYFDRVRSEDISLVAKYLSLFGNLNLRGELIYYFRVMRMSMGYVELCKESDWLG